MVGPVGGVMTFLEGRGMQGDYDTYAGTYVAASRAFDTHTGDRLVLRDDGTWSRLRGTRILDEGGRGTDMPTETDVKRLNWLGPSVTEECYEGVEGHCSSPRFDDDVSDAASAVASEPARCDTEPMTTPIQPPHGGHLLVLLRHAKSDWTGGEPDHDRDLAKRGRRQAPEAGAWLAENLDVDLALVSTATRARRTWDLVAGEMHTPPPVRLDERVYAASARRLLDVVHELPEEVGTAVVVGHNPGLEDLVSSLADQWIRLPTSAIAVLSVPGPWSAVGTGPATLVTSGRPPA